MTSISASHSAVADYSGFYSGPPSSLLTDVQSSDVVIFYGHGEWDRLVVDDGSGVMSDWVCSSPAPPALEAKDFSGELVVAVACQAGHQLGPDLKANGASAFLGFTDTVAVIHTPGLSSTHYEDAFIAGPEAVLDSLSSGDSPDVAAANGKTEWYRTFMAAYDYFKHDPAGAGHVNASDARCYAYFAAAHAVSL